MFPGEVPDAGEKDCVIFPIFPIFLRSAIPFFPLAYYYHWPCEEEQEEQEEQGEGDTEKKGGPISGETPYSPGLVLGYGVKPCPFEYRTLHDPQLSHAVERFHVFSCMICVTSIAVTSRDGFFFLFSFFLLYHSCLLLTSLVATVTSES